VSDKKVNKREEYRLGRASVDSGLGGYCFSAAREAEEGAHVHWQRKRIKKEFTLSRERKEGRTTDSPAEAG